MRKTAFYNILNIKQLHHYGSDSPADVPKHIETYQTT